LRRDLRGIGVGPQVAHRRRAALDLGDRAQAGLCERVCEPRSATENATSSSSRDAAAPESIDSRARSIPSRRFSA